MLGGRECSDCQKKAEGDGIAVFYRKQTNKQTNKQNLVLAEKKVKKLKEKYDKLIHSEKDWGTQTEPRRIKNKQGKQMIDFTRS